MTASVLFDELTLSPPGSMGVTVGAVVIKMNCDGDRVLPGREGDKGVGADVTETPGDGLPVAAVG